MSAIIYVTSENPIQLPNGQTLEKGNCVSIRTNVGTFDTCLEYAGQKLKGYSRFFFNNDVGLPVVQAVELPDDFKSEPAYIVCQEHPAPANATELYRFRFSDHGANCYKKAVWMYSRLLSLPGNKGNTFFVCDETWTRVVETPKTAAAANPPMLVTTYEMMEA